MPDKLPAYFLIQDIEIAKKLAFFLKNFFNSFFPTEKSRKPLWENVWREHVWKPINLGFYVLNISQKIQLKANYDLSQVESLTSVPEILVKTFLAQKVFDMIHSARTQSSDGAKVNILNSTFDGIYLIVKFVEIKEARLVKNVVS